MKIASKNTETKHTLARGSAKMLRKFASTAARLNGARGGVTTPRKAKNAAIATIKPNEPENAEDAAPAEEIADHAGDGGAERLPVRPIPSSRPIATWR